MLVNNERILSYKLSRKLSDADINDITAAGSASSTTTSMMTYAAQGGTDISIDISTDS